MMTVMWRSRKARRYVDAAISGNGKPKGWPQRAPLRPHVEGETRGSATPGRGGRRKRRRRARRWSPAEAALRAILATTGRRWIVLSPGATFHMLEARPPPGRRERRRRAKLRRRRTRRAARTQAAVLGRALGLALVREAILEHATGPALDRLAENLYGMSRTPGA